MDVSNGNERYMSNLSPESPDEKLLHQAHKNDGGKRKTIFEESEIYQIIFQEGYEEGYEESFEEGFRKKLGEAQLDQHVLFPFYRQRILRVIQDRFPDLIDLAELSLDKAVDPEHLSWLHCNIVCSRTQEEAEEVFADGGKNRLSTIRRMKCLKDGI